MFGVTRLGLGLAMVAAMAFVGCDAARGPAAPSDAPDLSGPAGVGESPASVAAASRVPPSGVVPVTIARGALEIASRYDARLNIGSHDPARFSWKGQLYEGWNPFDTMAVGVPGAVTPVDAMWIGLALNSTTVTWDKTSYTHIGGLTSNTGGVLHFVGSVTLPRYSGQASAKATGTFTIASAEYPSIFTVSGQPSSEELQLQLTGTGTATMMLDWVPDPLPGLPAGYWRLNRVVYRFD